MTSSHVETSSPIEEAIVSTPTGGLVELIDQNVDGFLSNDDNELTEEIVDILNNNELYSNLSKNALKKSQKINNIENYKMELNKYYFE